MHKLFKAVSPLTLALGLLMACGVAHADKNALTITVNPGWTNDDLVQLNGSSPCQIKATGNPDNDLTVTLGNPDGELSFDKTTFTVPKGGAPVSFTIYGLTTSSKPNEAVITASVTLPDSTQKQETSASVSVWKQFDPHVSAVSLSPYTFSSSTLTASPGAAIFLQAAHPVLPKGLSPYSPPFANLGVTVIQNMTSAAYTYTFENPSAVMTTTGVPQQPWAQVATRTLGIPQPSTDFVSRLSTTDPSYSVTGPLYGGPSAYSDICEGAYATTDNPSMPTRSLSLPFMSNGTKVGDVVYSNTKLSIAAGFVTYCADYNYSTKQPTPLREIGWNVNVNWDLTSTSNATNQMVTIPNPNDQAVTPTPVLDSAPTSSANYRLNNTPETQGHSGTVMLP